MTYTEAYKIIHDDLVDTQLANDDKWNEAILKALDALGKQVPKKPVKHTNFGKDILDGKYCHTCDTMFDRTTKFCDNCGQALDWSDEE